MVDLTGGIEEIWKIERNWRPLLRLFNSIGSYFACMTNIVFEGLKFNTERLGVNILVEWERLWKSSIFFYGGSGIV